MHHTDLPEFPTVKLCIASWGFYIIQIFSVSEVPLLLSSVASVMVIYKSWLDIKKHKQDKTGRPKHRRKFFSKP